VFRSSSETSGDFNYRLKSIAEFYYNGTIFAFFPLKQQLRILLGRIAFCIGCLQKAPSSFIDVFLSRRWGLGLAPVMMSASSACEPAASWHIHIRGRIGDSPPNPSWTCTPLLPLLAGLFSINHETLFHEIAEFSHYYTPLGLTCRGV
jgi:hypothetical protein